MSHRGFLTDAIQEKAKAFLNRSITGTELRLYPYIQYVMVNERKLNPAKVNSEERQILQQLRAEGHIEGGASGMGVSRDFWMYINDVLFDGYVAYDELAVADG